MKRVILVLMITAMMLAGSGFPALAQSDAPADPECGWYLNWAEDEEEVWWEYWCWWPGWGWEYVLWVWADLPDEDLPPLEEEDSPSPEDFSPPGDEDLPSPEDFSPPGDEDSPPPEEEDLSWPPEDWPWPTEEEA